MAFSRTESKESFNLVLAMQAAAGRQKKDILFLALNTYISPPEL
jgi:hypothetical protein